MIASSEPVAGIGVANRQSEEDEAKREQQNVGHLNVSTDEAIRMASGPS
jgi:hypothetical protein